MHTITRLLGWLTVPCEASPKRSGGGFEAQPAGPMETAPPSPRGRYAARRHAALAAWPAAESAEGGAAAMGPVRNGLAEVPPSRVEDRLAAAGQLYDALTVIYGCAQLLAREPLPPGARTDIERIMVSVRACHHAVRVLVSGAGTDSP